MAPERHLVELLALLIDAEEADVPDVVMAAGVDAAGDLDAQLADRLLALEIREALGDALGHGDRARVRERAVVEARAGDDVAREPDVGRGKAERDEGLPEREELAGLDVGEHQVLLVRHANLAEAQALGEIGQGLHLVGADVARHLADRLERDVGDGIARLEMRRRVVPQPAREGRIGTPLGLEAGWRRCDLLVGGGREMGADTRDLGLGQRERTLLDRGPLGLDEGGEFLDTELVHEDLDTRLEEVVAPAELVVDAQDGLEIGEEMLLRQEPAHGLGDERRASLAAAHRHLEADLARGVLPDEEADVVGLDRGAVALAHP